MKGDFKSLEAAFDALRELGYFAAMDFWCCQSCAVANVPKNKQELYTLFHNQDAIDLYDIGECYLAWAGDGQEIVRVLQENHVAVVWNGSPGNRILIRLSTRDGVPEDYADLEGEFDLENEDEDRDA